MFPEDLISGKPEAIMIHERGGLVLTFRVGFQIMHEGKDLTPLGGGQRFDFLDNLGGGHVNTIALTPLPANGKPERSSPT